MAERPDPFHHRRAATAHDEAVLRHEKAAAYWADRGNFERAELERRNAEIEREAAQLERDRADLIEREADAGAE